MHHDCCVLKSLEASSSLEDFELRTEYYLPKRGIRSLRIQWLREAANDEVAFCEVTDFDHALRGLKRRLQSCGLCHETVLKPDLCIFPLLFWHVCQLGRYVAEEDALVIATRLLLHLGQVYGKEQPLPPFEAMPGNVQKAMVSLHTKTLAMHDKMERKASQLQKEALTEIERCDRILGLRDDVELFDRNAYLEWGDARCRPCCSFHFMDTRGCASCERAFAKGRELNALKMDLPDWKALALRKAELQQELRFMLFEGAVKTLQKDASAAV